MRKRSRERIIRRRSSSIPTETRHRLPLTDLETNFVPQNDPKAQEKFQELHKAYSTLSDKKKRTLYDQVGAQNYERMQNTGGDASGFHVSADFGHGCIDFCCVD